MTAWIDDPISFTNSQIKLLIDEEIEKKYKFSDEKREIVEMINKCLQHLTCYCCLDTKKQLFDWKFFFMSLYGEFTCFVCTGEHKRVKSHRKIHHAKVRINGHNRQIPYYYKNSTGIIVTYLINMYKEEYENDLHEIIF
jgi:hypothetical protein